MFSHFTVLVRDPDSGYEGGSWGSSCGHTISQDLTTLFVGTDSGHKVNLIRKLNLKSNTDGLTSRLFADVSRPYNVLRRTVIPI